jgi:hypothetical protein
MITTSHPSSHLLILGSNSIQALLPAALSVQVESLLDDHKLPEAVALADKQRQKLQTQRNVTENEVPGSLHTRSLRLSAAHSGANYVMCTNA